MTRLFEPEYWAKARWDYIDAARSCRAALTDPNGYWKYAPDDPRIKKALEFWLYRARNAHAFALGRKPVIPNAVVISGGQMMQGALYTKLSTNNNQRRD